MAVMSSPYSWTMPEVGSISRVSSRTSVDLPEPERPITTKTSPGATSNETSRMPTTWPVFSWRSLRDSWASPLAMILSARGPKIFQSPSTWTAGDSELLVLSVVEVVVVVMGCPPCCGCRRAGRAGMPSR